MYHVHSSVPKLDTLDLYKKLKSSYKNCYPRNAKPSEHNILLKQGTKNAQMDFCAHQQKGLLLLIGKTLQLSTHS